MSLSIADLDFYQQDLPAESIAGGNYSKPVVLVGAIVATDIKAKVTITKGKYGLVGASDATSAGAAAGAAAAGYGTPSIFLSTTIS